MAMRAAAGEGASRQITLRQAVRPVIVAYGILGREQAAAGALTEEAQALVSLTGDLLRRLGRVHLLSAAAQADHEPAAGGDRLVDAYAQAGLAWAQVISSVARLAEGLAREGDWESAQLVADLLAESGEPGLSANVATLIGEARKAKEAQAAERIYKAQEALEAQVAALLEPIRFGYKMTLDEMRRAIDMFQVLEPSPQKKVAQNRVREFLIRSAWHLRYAWYGIEDAQSIESELRFHANRDHFFIHLSAILDDFEG